MPRRDSRKKFFSTTRKQRNRRGRLRESRHATSTNRRKK